MLHFEDIQIGETWTAGEHEMREEDIIAFAREWDPQPWHVDPDAAARSPMRGITASSCHTYAVAARLRLVLERLGTAGNLTTDAHLAVLAMERGYVLYSTDADFARFAGLRWVNPCRG